MSAGAGASHQQTDDDTIILQCDGVTHRLAVEKKLGEGAYGKVYKVKDLKGKAFAVKKINCVNRKVQHVIGQELSALLKLRHQYIVTLFQYDFDRTFAILVMDYCSGGNLNERLMRDISEEQKLQWMMQLIEAISYLHSENIVHRDLKPENVLLHDNKIKVADFGIARDFLCEGQNDQKRFLSDYVDNILGTFAGTPFWIAPEVFDLNYTEKADIFSLGVIFYAIVTRDYRKFGGTSYYGAFVKFRGEDVGLGYAMSEKKAHLVPTKFPTETRMNKCVIEVIKQMIHFDPNQRISLEHAKDALNEAFSILLSENHKEVVQVRNESVEKQGCCSCFFRGKVDDEKKKLINQNTSYKSV